MRLALTILSLALLSGCAGDDPTEPDTNVVTVAGAVLRNGAPWGGKLVYAEAYRGYSCEGPSVSARSTVTSNEGEYAVKIPFVSAGLGSLVCIRLSIRPSDSDTAIWRTGRAQVRTPRDPMYTQFNVYLP